MLEKIKSADIIRTTVRKNPFIHNWLSIDFFSNPQKTEVYGKVEDGILSSYIMIFIGYEQPIVIIYNYSSDMLDYINLVRGKRTVIWVFGEYEELFREMSKTEQVVLRDNVILFARKVNFYPGGKKLMLEDESAFNDFKAKVHWFKNSNFLAFKRYGSFEGEKLVAAALRRGEPNYCNIGGVYTLREYRGKGHAKKVVSLITRECLEMNLVPFLSVHSKNEPAIRAYKAIGFEEFSHFKWIKLNGFTAFDEET
ncbi:GNAT family N-acetyltransferase [Acidianus sp. RZ1]|uniref:GNAT family N-acetyltransferase n=1 Tax=Acidianus sp. RZ1 TaxID=1540082 RepID=UPI00149120B6|nr:GNAT family N-acetyltransferase [Acidianus sp. RZ1]NON62990.1 GNAT family N-acetyltransferase [Acidianus sp. RZ1]